MLIKNSFFAAVLMILSFSAQSVTLADVQQKLTAHSLLRGQFTQTKTMQMFNQPLVSKGKFLLHQDQGLLWKQVDPFSVSLVLVKDKLSQQFAEQAPEVIAAKDNPMVFYFTHLFLSLFKGDVDGLTDQFEMKLSEKGDNWLLLLTPREAPLNKVFANISIEGSDFIDVLVLSELSGDISEIKFAQQQTTPKTLSEEEQRAFQF
ncbi:outer membrane lipoprotein carrier protein LolA [Psychromonas aquimarina]|uniref:outer membrane lipoprotein carrier protein LolA n=1 Tax=Psychromonas aquimarina TaxID=444919 RepID=UPI00048D2DD4|nr:outer membrane lipoprotein carrier protein LolA [Psychromonas aquimarina]